MITIDGVPGNRGLPSAPNPASGNIDAIIGDLVAFEFFYNNAPTPWLSIGPDIQYVKPAREGFDNALVLGLRLQLKSRAGYRRHNDHGM